LKGLIKRSTGSWYEIWDFGLNIVSARIKGKLKLDGIKSTNPVAVGDYVEYSWDQQHKSAVIESLYPRRNYIIRKSNNLSRQTQIIAANIDLMVIFATLAYPKTSQGFIDRLLITAEAYDIPALIIFNKTDLHLPQMDETMRGLTKLYETIGYKCLSISAKKEIGINKFYDEIQGKTILITGHSGTGKSTIVNKLNDSLQLKTGVISNHSLKGKHTTTFAEMHMIDKNTFVIDTPGIKEFGIVDITQEEIGHYFPEMRSLLGKCRFNNCLHINEPGCAILEAIEEGIIQHSRYYSYLSMMKNEDTHH
jgi:ribosome biogenesis GTPase